MLANTSTITANTISMSNAHSRHFRLSCGLHMYASTWYWLMIMHMALYTSHMACHIGIGRMIVSCTIRFTFFDRPPCCHYQEFGTLVWDGVQTCSLIIGIVSLQSLPRGSGSSSASVHLPMDSANPRSANAGVSADGTSDTSGPSSSPPNPLPVIESVIGAESVSSLPMSMGIDEGSTSALAAIPNESEYLSITYDDSEQLGDALMQACSPSPKPNGRRLCRAHSEYDRVMQKQERLDSTMGFNDMFFANRVTMENPDVLRDNLDTGVLQYGCIVSECFSPLGCGCAAG